jgi:hypothetical protein
VVCYTQSTHGSAGSIWQIVAVLSEEPMKERLRFTRQADETVPAYAPSFDDVAYTIAQARCWRCWATRCQN